jgi:hypothetical protein
VGLATNPTNTPKPVTRITTSPPKDESGQSSDSCSIEPTSLIPKRETTPSSVSQIPILVTPKGKNPAFASIETGRERREQEASNPDVIPHLSRASALSSDTVTLAYGKYTLDSRDDHSRRMTATNVLIDSSPSREWETVDSVNKTPALTDDDGDEFDDTLQTLQEGIEAGIWVTHGVTSTQHRLALS